jgi:hypothetical protein
MIGDIVLVVALFAMMWFIQIGFDEWERHRFEIERQDAAREWRAVWRAQTQGGRAMDHLIYWFTCLVFVALAAHAHAVSSSS